MFCSNCGKEIQDGAVFCSNCGVKVGISTVTEAVQTPERIECDVNENQTRETIESNFNQSQTAEATKPQSQPKVNIADTLNKVKENEFVKSVKQDVGNSQSINMIKNKVSSSVEKAKNNQTRKINKTIPIIIVAVIAVLVIVFNIHTCEECEELYFGKKNTISFWGEYAEVCDECYEDFYSW